MRWPSSISPPIWHISALSGTAQPAELVERYLPTSETIAKAKYREVWDHLQTLPKTRANYSLIHQGIAHGSNFLVDDTGTITLFDFDDCVYSWFSNDIAIVLFYIVQDADEPVHSPASF